MTVSRGTPRAVSSTAVAQPVRPCRRAVIDHRAAPPCSRTNRRYRRLGAGQGDELLVGPHQEGGRVVRVGDLGDAGAGRRIGRHVGDHRLAPGGRRSGPRCAPARCAGRPPMPAPGGRSWPGRPRPAGRARRNDRPGPCAPAPVAGAIAADVAEIGRGRHVQARSAVTSGAPWPAQLEIPAVRRRQSGDCDVSVAPARPISCSSPPSRERRPGEHADRPAEGGAAQAIAKVRPHPACDLGLVKGIARAARRPVRQRRVGRARPRRGQPAAATTQGRPPPSSGCAHRHPPFASCPAASEEWRTVMTPMFHGGGACVGPAFGPAAAQWHAARMPEAEPSTPVCRSIAGGARVGAERIRC